MRRVLPPPHISVQGSGPRGSYGVDEGVIFGFPVTCSGGAYEIVQGLDLNDFSQSRLDVTVNELQDERETVKQLDLV